MEIVPIFGNYLFSFKYNEAGEKKDEFTRLFELWQDPEYLEEFFEQNKADLINEFWRGISIETAIFATFEYAQKFEKKLISLSKLETQKQFEGLDQIFRPLHKIDNDEFLIKSKARQTWLRLYALKVESNVYIVTGGVIKLTQKMQDREHTNRELIKINKCREFLKEQGIIDLEGVIGEIEL